MTWCVWKPDAQVLGDSAVGHTNSISLGPPAIKIHCRRLWRTLLPKWSVRRLMPERTTATAHPPSREHPMLRRRVGKVYEFRAFV